MRAKEGLTDGTSKRLDSKRLDTAKPKLQFMDFSVIHIYSVLLVLQLNTLDSSNGAFGYA